MTTDTVGGVWSYAVELVRALASREVDVSLATMGAPLTREQSKEALKLHNAHICESRFRLEWMEKPWLDLARAGEWLLQLEAESAPEVVHLNNYVHAALAFRAPRVVVGHSCVLSWWEAVKGVSAPGEWDWYRYQVTRGLQAASLVLAPSRTMLEALQRHYGPFQWAEVIPNGRDPQVYLPLRKEPFVLMAGRIWDEAKNLQALIEASPGMPWPVYVAGEQKHPDQGWANLGPVHALGRMPSNALAPWYGRASIYALPARYEPFGLSVLEAGLAGCALVLGDIPSLRETWDGAALFAPPGDSEALKACLTTLIREPGTLRSFADRARTRALAYTPERMATGYLSAYADLMMTEIPRATELTQQLA
jgi:glycosyltransferase involved in cell wall biosynthesis